MFSRVASILLSCQSKYELVVYTAHAVFPKLFERILLHREAFLTVIDVLVNVVPSIRPKITELLIYSEQSHKYHQEVVPALLHYNMLSLSDYDAELADSIENRRDPHAIEFANFLLQNMVKVMALSPVDLILTLEVLYKFNPTDLELRSLVESVRGPQYFALESSANQLGQALLPSERGIGGVEGLGGGGLVSGGADFRAVLPMLERQVLNLFEEWLLVYKLNDPNHIIAIIRKFQQLGFFATKEPSEIDFVGYQVCIEAAVYQCLTTPRELDQQQQQEKDEELSLLHHAASSSDPTMASNSGETKKNNNNNGNSTSSSMNYKPIEAVGKLLYQMVRFAPDRLYALNCILNVLGKVMHHNYQGEFDQRPYFKLFVTMLTEFNGSDGSLDPINLDIFLQFKDLLHVFRPALYPAFTFAWFDLISHRTFMPQLLRDTATWVAMKDLLVDAFEFLEPPLRLVQLSPPIQLLYQGILRILLVLLHDFPEFLCDYHFAFCDVLPPTCIQLRNLILSAFPQSMKLPDPFIPHESIPEIKDSPLIRSKFVDVLIETGVKAPLDAFLASCSPNTFLVSLAVKLFYVPPENAYVDPAVVQMITHGSRYNIHLINALVTYLGICALSEHHTSEFTPPAVMEIFTFLALQLDQEGRYLLFNAIANQLRYPNNQTHYFSCVLLYLFAELGSYEIVQEQITRVLVERLIVHRPHPWGLLITFFELIQNPRYNFWARSFTRCAPEIERLFRQIGSHIAQHKTEMS